MTKLIVAGLVGLAASGCVPTASSDWLTQPADPAIMGPPPRYAAVTAGAGAFRVVEPKDWRRLNRMVSPAGKSQSMPGMKGMPGMKAMPGMTMPGAGEGGRR